MKINNIRCKSNGTKRRSGQFFIDTVVEQKFFYQSIRNFPLFQVTYNLFLSYIHKQNGIRRKRGTLKIIPHFLSTTISLLWTRVRTIIFLSADTKFFPLSNYIYNLFLSQVHKSNDIGRKKNARTRNFRFFIDLSEKTYKSAEIWCLMREQKFHFLLEKAWRTKHHYLTTEYSPSHHIWRRFFRTPWTIACNVVLLRSLTFCLILQANKSKFLAPQLLIYHKSFFLEYLVL